MPSCSANIGPTALAVLQVLDRCSAKCQHANTDGLLTTLTITRRWSNNWLTSELCYSYSSISERDIINLSQKCKYLTMTYVAALSLKKNKKSTICRWSEIWFFLNGCNCLIYPEYKVIWKCKQIFNAQVRAYTCV